MGGIEQKAVEILDKLDSIATQHAPDVINSAIKVVQVDGVSHIFYGIIGIIGCFTCVIVAKKLANKCTELKKSGGYNSDWEVGIAVSYILGTVVTIVLAICSIIELFDVWNWIAMFNPKIALANKLFGM